MFEGFAESQSFFDTETKKFMLLSEEVIMRRFIWLKGNRKGELLKRYEIEALGMFLPGGALYGKEDNYKW